jgi:hypothetical protein
LQPPIDIEPMWLNFLFWGSKSPPSLNRPTATSHL